MISDSIRKMSRIVAPAVRQSPCHARFLLFRYRRVPDQQHSAETSCGATWHERFEQNKAEVVFAVQEISVRFWKHASPFDCFAVDLLRRLCSVAGTKSILVWPVDRKRKQEFHLLSRHASYPGEAGKHLFSFRRPWQETCCGLRSCVTAAAILPLPDRSRACGSRSRQAGD